MKVISLVPSWTETLISWQVPVVGRTRFCLHPADQVADIPSFGGTKNPDWDAINQWSPDLVVVDKEENTADAQEKCRVPLHVTHVQSVRDMPREYENFAEVFAKSGDSEICKNIERDLQIWQRLLAQKWQVNLRDLPGVLEWLQPIEEPIEKIIYLIWRHPWMTVSRQTFIGSLFSLFGFESLFFASDSKYPEVELQDYLNKNALLLFSSEPFPFAKYKEELAGFPAASALVDGECFSWFGSRTMKFLESIEKTTL